MKPIGVFDSGVGGQHVADVIKTAIPNREVILVEDREHLPYGTKTPDELLSLVLPKLKSLEEQGCEIIVVACNTVTTTIIEELRKSISIPLIGMEPMVKPAGEQTKTKIIAVCATPATLASKRYQWLKETYAVGLKVLEPNCSDWASLIEANALNQEHIKKMVDEVCSQGADVIVLGCTHYHWIEDLILQEVAGRALVLQPTQPVIEQLSRVLGSIIPSPLA
jgi:glutamate racemase